jgi:hypothetical protein
MLDTTIRVQVAGSVREYPTMIAEFGDYLASDGVVIALDEARRAARKLFKSASSAWVSASYWVTLDSSGLAYRVEISRHGSHKITGAAPLPGPGNVQELYVA